MKVKGKTRATANGTGKGKMLSFKCEADLYDSLKGEQAKTDVPLSVIIRRALRARKVAA